MNASSAPSVPTLVPKSGLCSVAAPASRRAAISTPNLLSPRAKKTPEPDILVDSAMARIQASVSQLGINHKTGLQTPARLDALASSINIMQVLISRSRLASEPADVRVTPLLVDLGLMEFHRASVASEVGQQTFEEAMPQLQARLNGLNEA